MPRITKRPTCFVALSPAGLATACGIDVRIVYDAILTGELGPVYQRGMARRILISDAEAWIRAHWRKARPKKSKKEIPHGDD